MRRISFPAWDGPAARKPHSSDEKPDSCPASVLYRSLKTRSVGGRRHTLQIAPLFQRHEPTPFAHDDVIQHLDAVQLPRLLQPPGHPLVLRTGRWVAARIVVTYQDTGYRLLENLPRMYQGAIEEANAD